MNNSYGKIPTIDQLSTEEAAVLFTISTVIAIVALPLNILVLFGYLCSSSARQKPSSILLASVTFGHVLTGSWIIPFHMVFQMIKPGLVESGGTLCTILLPMTYSPYVAISETILLMTVDRYFAVCAMMKYRLIMTRRRTFAAVLFTWLHALVYGAIILPFGYKIEYNHRLGTCGVDFENRLLEGAMMAVVYAVIPLFIMAMLSYKTVKHLRRHNRRLVSNSETVRPPNGESDSRDQAIRAQERQLLSMVFWIIITCFVCWTPAIIVGTLQSTPGFNAYPPPFLYTTAQLFLHLSDICNPVLNLYFRQDIRRTIKKLFARCRGRLEARAGTEG